MNAPAGAAAAPRSDSRLGLGLGLDVGGSHTRWALADAAGALCAEGQAPAWTALLLHDATGRAAVQVALAELLRAAHAQPAARAQGRHIAAAVAGITGFDAAHGDALQALWQAAWAEVVATEEGAALAATAARAAPAAPALRPMSDIELLCRAIGAPGRGLVLYAGTGSVSAALAADGTLLRAGGRGVLLDDAGGGHWIATRALRALWRLEDAQPGAAAATALGRRLFAVLGGSDWAATRRGVYGASRGEVGALALAVAAAARDDHDPRALALLQAAGRELARLALALLQRGAAPPVVLAGRAWMLHPAIETALRAALPPDCAVHALAEPAHVSAARMALQTLSR